MQNVGPIVPRPTGVLSFFQTMSTQTKVLIGVALAALIFIGFFIYQQTTNTKTAFSANREGQTVDPATSNKTANLMLFYVDWCPHCKTAKPEWNALKAEYEGKNINGYNIVFSEYNCTEETPEIVSLMDKYSIDGYPTIKLVKDNQIIEYDAKPTKATMANFLNTVL